MIARKRAVRGAIGPLFALVLLLGGCSGASRAEGTPEVRVRPLQVAAEPAALGALRLEAAFVLSSSDPAFGGLSGVWLAPDGTHLIAASDRGALWSARLDHAPDGRLTRLSGWRALTPAVAPGDDPGSLNAESLADDGRGGLVIAYEGAHRLRRLPLDDLGAMPGKLPTPRALARPGNTGIEALVGLRDGTLLALSEGLLDANGEIEGWLIGDDRIERLGYAPTGGFVPTGADRAGDLVFVLERQFSLFGGFSSRLVLLDASDLRPGARLRGYQLARLQRPLVSENFEAIAARVGPDGRVLLYLLSDDNFNALQRTLLLQLSIDPGRLPGAGETVSGAR